MSDRVEMVTQAMRSESFIRCQRLVGVYNAIGCGEDRDAERREVLTQLFARFGRGTTVMPRLSCDFGSNVSIGDYVRINRDVVLVDDGPIEIGDYVRFGPRVQLLTALHPVDDYLLRRQGIESARPVVVEDDAWLGAGSVVCPGVTIGARSVIGAGSVVTRSVTADVLAVGNPCRVVRRLERK